MKIHGVNLNPDGDMVCRSFMDNGQKFENCSMALWQRVNSRPGCVAIDAGAYTGLYAIAAAMAGSTVYAFEPNPANYIRMVENLSENEHNGGFSAYRAAAGKEPGRGDLYDLNNRPTLTSAGKVRTSEGGPLEVMTIDGLNVPRCDIIKIDVEGGELDVLRGAAETIAGYLPALIIEANSEAEREAIDRELSQYGYRKGSRADVRNLLYLHPDR